MYFLLLTAKTALTFATELQPISFSSYCQNGLRSRTARAQFAILLFHTGSKVPSVTGEKPECDYRDWGRKEVGVVYFWSSAPKIHSTLWLGKIKLHVMYYKGDLKLWKCSLPYCDPWTQLATPRCSEVPVISPTHLLYGKEKHSCCEV